MCSAWRAILVGGMIEREAAALAAAQIDWTNGTRGDPAADVARSILLAGEGILRRILVAGYLRAYAHDLPLDRARVDRWLPVWAAARLSEDIEPERGFLLDRAS